MMSTVWILVAVLAVFATSASRTQAQSVSCTTPTNQAGTCVPLVRCRNINRILQLNQPIPPKLQDYIRQAMCRLPGQSNAICCQLNQVDKMPAGKSPLPTECGTTTADRVANGQKTVLFEFPWMALLRYRNFDGEIVDGCGGSLINEQHVLTAAHCLRDNKLVLDHVRLGEHDKSKAIDCEGPDGDCAGPVQDIGIERIFIHQQYKKPTKFSNDIGLIRMKKVVKFEDNIRPICLPVTPALQKLQHPKYILTGWGKTEKNELSDVLLQAVLPRIDNSQCEQLLRKTQQYITLTDKQMCAGGKDLMDSCRGDSGGPLGTVAELHSAPRFVQFGIVSFGASSCGVQNIPSIYTRVGSYMDWIMDTLKTS